MTISGRILGAVAGLAASCSLASNQEIKAQDWLFRPSYAGQALETVPSLGANAPARRRPVVHTLPAASYYREPSRLGTLGSELSRLHSGFYSGSYPPPPPPRFYYSRPLYR